jgi:hypothetical protein
LQPTPRGSRLVLTPSSPTPSEPVRVHTDSNGRRRAALDVPRGDDERLGPARVGDVDARDGGRAAGVADRDAHGGAVAGVREDTRCGGCGCAWTPTRTPTGRSTGCTRAMPQAASSSSRTAGGDFMVALRWCRASGWVPGGDAAHGVVTVRTFLFLTMPQHPRKGQELARRPERITHR